MPPAVLTSTASGPPAQALGNRTRSEPSSRVVVRRVPLGVAATARQTRPTARLAAKGARVASSSAAPLPITLPRRSPPPGGGGSARVSGPGGGDSASTYAAAPSPHPGRPSAVRPSPSRGG